MGEKVIHYGKCPMCGTISKMELNEEEATRVALYQVGIGYIQKALPECNAPEREFIKTGYCLRCQEVLFCNPAPENCRVQTN